MLARDLAFCGRLGKSHIVQEAAAFVTAAPCLAAGALPRGRPQLLLKAMDPREETTTLKSSAELAASLQGVACQLYTEDRLRFFSKQALRRRVSQREETKTAPGKEEAAAAQRRPPRFVVADGDVESLAGRAKIFEQVGHRVLQRLLVGQDACVLLCAQQYPNGAQVWGTPRVSGLEVTRIKPQLLQRDPETDESTKLAEFPSSHGLVPRLIEALVESGRRVDVLHEGDFWVPAESAERAFLVASESRQARPLGSVCWIHGLRVSVPGAGSGTKAYAFLAEVKLPETAGEWREIDERARVLGSLPDGCAIGKLPAELRGAHLDPDAWRLVSERKLAERFLFLRDSLVVVPSTLLSVAIRVVRCAAALYDDLGVHDKLQDLDAFREAPFCEEVVQFNECELRVRVRRAAQLETGRLRDRQRAVLASQAAGEAIACGIINACASLRTQALQNLFQRRMLEQRDEQAALGGKVAELNATCEALRVQREEVMTRLAETTEELEMQKRKYLELSIASKQRERHCDSLQKDVDSAGCQLFKIAETEGTAEAGAEAEGPGVDSVVENNGGEQDGSASGVVPASGVALRELEVQDILSQASRLQSALHTKLRTHSSSGSRRSSTRKVKHDALLEEANAIMGALAAVVVRQQDHKLVEENRCLRAQLEHLQNAVQKHKGEVIDSKRSLAVLRAELGSSREISALASTKGHEALEWTDEHIDKLPGHLKQYAEGSGAVPSAGFDEEELRRMKAQQRELERVLDAAKAEQAASRQAASEAEARLEKLQAEVVPSLEARIDDYKTSVSMARGAAAEARSQLAALKATQAQLSTQLAEERRRRMELEDEASKLDGLKSRLAEAEAIAEQRRDELELREAQVVGLSAPSRNVVEVLRAQALARGHIARVIQSQALREKEQAHELATKRAEVEQLRASLSRESKSLREARKSAEQTAAQIHHLNKHREAQKHVAGDLRAQISKQHGLMGELRAELEMYKRKCDRLEETVHGLHNASEHSVFEGEAPSAKAGAEPTLSACSSFRSQDSLASKMSEGPASRSPGSPRAMQRLCFQEAYARFLGRAGGADGLECSSPGDADRLLQLAQRDIDELLKLLDDTSHRFTARLVQEEACRKLVKLFADKEHAAISARIEVLEAAEAARAAITYAETEAQTEPPEPQASAAEIMQVCEELSNLHAKVAQQSCAEEDELVGELREARKRLHASFEKGQTLHLLKEKWKSKYVNLKNSEQEWREWNALLEAQLNRATSQAKALKKQLTTAQVRNEQLEQERDEALAASCVDLVRSAVSVTDMLALFKVSEHLSAPRRGRVRRILSDLEVCFRALEPFLDHGNAGMASPPVLSPAHRLAGP